MRFENKFQAGPIAASQAYSQAGHAVRTPPGIVLRFLARKPTHLRAKNLRTR